MAAWRVTVTFHGEHDDLAPVVADFERLESAMQAVANAHKVFEGSSIRYRVAMARLDVPVNA